MRILHMKSAIVSEILHDFSSVPISYRYYKVYPLFRFSQFLIHYGQYVSFDITHPLPPIRRRLTYELDLSIISLILI